MKIAVIGLGYVGLTTALGIAELGHKVLGIETDLGKISDLLLSRPHIYEPGLTELLSKHVNNENFLITDDYRELSNGIEFVFICVPTPTSENGSADLTYIDQAIAASKQHLKKESVLIMKSTVPIGTCTKLASNLKNDGLSVVSNPEFLAEGTAVPDFFNPSRIVVGAETEELAKRVLAIFESIVAPNLICDLTSAETIKHASNSFLALKLSFVNEVASLCEETGANAEMVFHGMSFDDRIGDKFLKPGPGWGGSCFPKDTKELAFAAKLYGIEMKTVEAAITSNLAHMNRIKNSFTSQLGAAPKKIAVLGLTFKAGTNDLRESPAIAIAESLADNGYRVVAYDPMVSKFTSDKIEIQDSILQACNDVDGILVLTEWMEFSEIDPNLLDIGNPEKVVVFDTRNILNSSIWSQRFPRFFRIGRSWQNA